MIPSAIVTPSSGSAGTTVPAQQASSLRRSGLWAMSNERIRSAMRRWRARETAHAPTRATVYHHISLYHMLRGDPEAVRRIFRRLSST